MAIAPPQRTAGAQGTDDRTRPGYVPISVKSGAGATKAAAAPAAPAAPAAVKGPKPATFAVPPNPVLLERGGHRTSAERAGVDVDRRRSVESDGTPAESVASTQADPASGDFYGEGLGTAGALLGQRGAARPNPND